MSIINNYDNFFLPADDLQAAKDFYKGMLGLELKFDFSEIGMIAFKIGHNEPAIILRTDKDLKPAIWFKVENVQKAFEELKEKGIQFAAEPFEIHTGYSAEFYDPFATN